MTHLRVSLPLLALLFLFTIQASAHELSGFWKSEDRPLRGLPLEQFDVSYLEITEQTVTEFTTFGQNSRAVKNRYKSSPHSEIILLSSDGREITVSYLFKGDSFTACVNESCSAFNRVAELPAFRSGPHAVPEIHAAYSWTLNKDSLTDPVENVHINIPDHFAQLFPSRTSFAIRPRSHGTQIWARLETLQLGEDENAAASYSGFIQILARGETDDHMRQVGAPSSLMTLAPGTHFVHTVEDAELGVVNFQLILR